MVPVEQARMTYPSGSSAPALEPVVCHDHRLALCDRTRRVRVKTFELDPAMKSFHRVMLGSGLCSLLLAVMLPVGAVAGQPSAAEAAIAEARGKLDAGDKAGGSSAMPDRQAKARKTLMAAEDLLARHKTAQAVTTAHHASKLADQAAMDAGNRPSANDNSGTGDMTPMPPVLAQPANDTDGHTDLAGPPD